MDDQNFSKIIEIRRRLITRMNKINTEQKTSSEILQCGFKTEAWQEEWMAFSLVLGWTSELFFDDDQKPRRNRWENKCHQLTKILAADEAKIRELTVRAEKAEYGLYMLQICHWSEEDSELNWWKSECGQGFWFEEESPTGNKWKFCPFCGKRLVMKADGINTMVE